MADVSNAIRTRLTEHAGTTALIGSRAYYLALPQDPTLPAAIVQQISAPRISAMGSDIALFESRQQVKACASTRAGAKALAEQHRGALQRYRGTVADVVIADCFLVGEDEQYEADTKVWAFRHDYMVWASE